VNRLIIIGNGFDLAHGLKTSYEDFMRDFIIECLRIVDQKMRHIDQLWEIRSLVQPGVISASMELDNSSDNLRQIVRNSCDIVKWHSPFFRDLYHVLSEQRWVDIESTYYTALIEELKRPIQDHDNLKKLNSDFDFLKKKLVAYLSKQEAAFNLKDKAVLVSKYKSIFQKNLTAAKVPLGNEIGRVTIVNFNYTGVITMYLKEMMTLSIGQIQVHGCSMDSDTIIFGFGDELDEHYQDIEKINDNNYFRHIKSFGYFKNSAYRKLMNIVDSRKFEVCVFGHSLGLSDRTMFSQIFESPNLQDVKIFYYQREDGTNDFTEKTHEISRHFKNKGRMRLKIVPFSESEPMPQLTPKK
jgi:hypothetical protein